MKWLKRLWQKYMRGAKANDFPIRSCGLFGDKLKKPHNLGEAAKALDYIITPEDKERFEGWSEEKFVCYLHHLLGRWIRNNWGLWNEDNKLHKWFKALGIWHADDMSGIILTTYYRKTHNMHMELGEQIKHYKKYWAEQSQEKQDE